MSNYHQLKPAHSLAEVIIPDGANHNFFEAICDSHDFQSASSEREQVHYIFSRKHEYDLRISLQDIANFMNVSKATIQYHLSRECEANFYKIGRPSLLSEEQHSKLFEFVFSCFKQKTPCTYEQVRDFLFEKFELSINIVSLRSYISRCRDMRTCIGRPLEDNRLYADPEKIDKYFEQLKNIMCFCIPASFIINIDEVGFQEYSDRRDIMCIVPFEYVGNDIKIPVSRDTKRSTLLAGIYADGSRAKGLIAISRCTIETELYDFGYTPDKVILGYSESGYMNTNIFMKWAKKCFLPELAQRRCAYNYDGPALMILDGFGVHSCSDFEDLCDENNVFLQLIPPHSSDQLQFLDLGIFAIQKRWMSNISIPCANMNPQTKQVIRIHDSYVMSTTPKNIIGAFRAGGIITKWDNERQMLMAEVRPELAHRVRHYAHDGEYKINQKRIDIQ